MYLKDRDSRGGGVLLAANKKFTTSLMPSPSDIEVITTSFHNPNPFIICVTYIPPNSIVRLTITLFSIISLNSAENPAPSY